MRTRPQLLIIVLSAFALRALIPMGFMPAADGTLSLMICPGGFPLELLPREGMKSDGMGMPMPQAYHGQEHGQQHGQRQGLMEDGFCIFTSGFSSAPPPLLAAALYVVLAVIAAIAISMAAPADIRLVHVPQARAPPFTV